MCKDDNKETKNMHEMQQELYQMLTDLKGMVEGMSEDSGRILHITGEITQEKVNEIFESIMIWNHEDLDISEPFERVPIFVLINSYGGSISNGFSLYNMFRSCKTPIIGIVVGVCFSAATLALLGCHYKLILENAYIMVHRSHLESWSGGAIDMQSYSKFWNKLEDTLVSIYLENLEISSADLHSRLTGDWYMTAKEAVEIKMCNEILTNLDDLG